MNIWIQWIIVAGVVALALKVAVRHLFPQRGTPKGANDAASCQSGCANCGGCAQKQRQH